MRALLSIGVAALGAALLVGPAAARKARPVVPPPKKKDISAIFEELAVFTDGKGHYFVTRLPPAKIGRIKESFYYGDGKTFYWQRIPTIGGDRTRFTASIGDPRVLYGSRSAFTYRDEKASFQCEGRNNLLKLVPHKKAQAMLKKATYYDLYWTRVPHALARDNEGHYYYVDRLRSMDWIEQGYRGFRVFAGERGKMKQLRMKNVVSDVRGQIFITSEGKLRLILANNPNNSKTEKVLWLKGKDKTDLTIVPVAHLRTRVMIYRSLGVYQGVRMHKPCDDL